MTDHHLRYPIGKPQIPAEITPSQITTWLADFKQFPKDFRQAAEAVEVAGKLDTPYRPGGWTGRQVIHHVPDSHLNAYARFKIALTEDHPTVRPYDEVEWARLPDYEYGIHVGLIGLDLH
ncbi:MAG: DinB family protein, partial [Bacteroidota bacterium]